MEKKITKKELSRIIRFRKDNPKKETNHERRSRIKKKSPWWISND